MDQYTRADGTSGVALEDVGQSIPQSGSDNAAGVAALATARIDVARTGYYEIRYSQCIAPGKWRSQRLSCRTKNRAHAQAYLEGWLAIQRQEAAQVQAQTQAVQNVDTLCKAYLAVAEDDRHIGDTQRRSLLPIQKHLGAYRPADLSSEVLSDYRKLRGALKDGTLRRELGALTAVMNWARKHKKVHPHDVPFIELPPQSEARKLFMNEEQEKHLHALALAGCEDAPTPLALFVALALNCGARKTAIHELVWERVDMASGTIDFRRTGRHKTKKRRVTVPINTRLRAVLEAALAHGPLTGRVVTESGWATRRQLIKLARRAKLPWVTPHVCRHTLATLMARRGVSLWEIAGVLGDTIKTVTDNYMHHCPEHLRQALEG